MSSKEPSNATKVDILADYNIRGIIGKGTFSVVKLGENKQTKEKVAIKILQKNKILNKEDLIRIQREIEILRRLKHPNVIKIHRIEEDEKKFYIIMEYCEHGELFNRIVEKRCLTEDEAALFYYQLINGLEYIHKNNIVHRDLKPENLLLSKKDLLKIIDFGLSNYTSYNILLGTPCGSPCYASPEMVSGQRYNGYMIDVWSTGIILFAMVNGYLPFEDSDNEILFGKILKCKIHYPKTMGDLTLDLMKKIITPDPKKRITLEQIKQHSFYLKGKYLFDNKFPELIDEINVNNNSDDNINNIPIKEIIIKNVTPIVKNKILKNIKENKEKNIKNTNVNINARNNIKYYPIKIKDITNIPQPYTTTSKIYPEQKKIQINPLSNSKQRDNLDSINYKNESPSDLKPDEIPKDSDPTDYTNKSNNNKNKNITIDIKKNLKEEMNSINLTEENNLKTYKIHKTNPKTKNVKVITREKEKEILDRFQKVTDKLGNVIHLTNKARTKEKDNKKNNNYISSPLNKLNEGFVDNIYQKEKLNGTLDNTTTVAIKMDYYNTNDDNKKNKYSRITHKIEKSAELNNKTNPLTDDKNKNALNQKITKITNTFSKRIQRKPIYVTVKEIERNKKNEIENYTNLTNIVRPNFVNIHSKLNSYTYDKHNNTMEEINNNNNIKEIFNEMKIINNSHKTLNNDINTINSINTYNNTININERNIERPLIITKTSTQIKKKEPNSKKEIYINNNYLTSRDNNININTEKDYRRLIKNKNMSLNRNSKTRKLNIPMDNNKIYINSNSTNFQGVSPLNDKYFDTITINNNNNNINLHEPKLYIYVQNNNNNGNNNIQYQRLKTESNQNKTKMMFKFEKKNNSTAKNTNKINSVEYRRIFPSKKTNNDIIENKTIENDYNMNLTYKITPTKNTQINDRNIKDIKPKEKYMINKKNYYTNEQDKKEGYKLKANDIIFNNNLKNKDNNMKYIINKNNNNNVAYYERFNTSIDNNSINNYNISNSVIDNTTNNYKNIDKSNYFYQNIHNALKTDINMDLWSYVEERNVNNNRTKYNNINKNIPRIIRDENINNYNNKNSFDNTDYSTKLKKFQVKGYANNNIGNISKTMKYIIPNNSNTIDSINTHTRINPIVIDNMNNPITKQNYKNMIKYKQYIKYY